MELLKLKNRIMLQLFSINMKTINKKLKTSVVISLKKFLDSCLTLYIIYL